MRFLVLVPLLASCLVLARSTEMRAAEDGVRNSVVRVFVTQRAPNFLQPWTKAAPRESTGTGFVIDGKRILTNAHVVRYASQIYVQGYQSADKAPAKVIVAAPGIDLALLSVDDEEFFASRPPIPLAEGLPVVRSQVNVYGFPVGGEQMSVTEGIVSRVEYAQYFYRTKGLRVQIDAALNPGNSGGPAVTDGKLVGVAFSGLTQAENIGYLIPVDELSTFLADVADGSYQGKPQMFDELQTVENDALRARLGLPKGMGGAMITRPAEDGAKYPLKELDVVTKIGDHAIDSAGNVQVADDLRLPFIYYVPKLVADGKVKLTVFRAGKEEAVELPVAVDRPSVIVNLGDGYPSYFIHGPLVFSSLSMEFVQHAGVLGQMMMQERGLVLLRRLNDEPKFPGQELVIVSSPLFAHRITKSYGQPILNLLTTVNGVEVRNLAHLVELLRDAQGEFIEFKFAGRDSETLVFRRQEIADATEEILTDNGIRKQFSDDVAPVWTGAKK